MNTDQRLQHIEDSLRKLRADLMATNLALTAACAAMPEEQHATTMQLMARLAAMQEQTALRSPTPEVIELIQPAVDRLASALQGAQKMRASGLL